MCCMYVCMYVSTCRLILSVACSGSVAARLEGWLPRVVWICICMECIDGLSDMAPIVRVVNTFGAEYSVTFNLKWEYTIVVYTVEIL